MFKYDYLRQSQRVKIHLSTILFCGKIPITFLTNLDCFHENIELVMVVQ